MYAMLCRPADSDTVDNSVYPLVFPVARALMEKEVTAWALFNLSEACRVQPQAWIARAHRGLASGSPPGH